MAKLGLSWNDKIPQMTKDLLKDAVSKTALDLQSESAKQAPKLTGDLEGNCNISDWQQGSGGEYLTVGYDLPYARRQHEIPFNHPLKGKWKYLEDPYKDNEKRYFAYIIKRLKAFFGT